MMKRLLALLLALITCTALVACKDETKKTENDGESRQSAEDQRPAELAVGDVEITTENWQTYFEIVEKAEVEVNNLGDVNHVQIHRLIKLKDEYRDYCSASTVGYRSTLSVKAYRKRISLGLLNLDGKCRATAHHLKAEIVLYKSYCLV